MKVPNQKTSFGMPDELKKADQEFREKRAMEQERASEEAEDSVPVNDMSEEFDINEGDKAFQASLKDLGVEITPEDINRLIMFNNFEKTVTVYKCPYTEKSFDVTFKALSAEEFGLSDSLLVDQIDVQGVKASSQGIRERKTLWTLAFSVIKINGNPLVKPVQDADDKDKIDLEKTAKLSYKALSRMNPLLIDKMSRTHARLTLACRAIIEDPNSPLLKRP